MNENSNINSFTHVKFDRNGLPVVGWFEAAKDMADAEGPVAVAPEDVAAAEVAAM